jgi:F-type H+-transporting ATPase subunit alpha
MGLSLYAVNEGYLDGVDVAKISDFEAALHDYARANNNELMEKINESGDYDDDIQASLKAVCDGFAEKGAY